MRLMSRPDPATGQALQYDWAVDKVLTVEWLCSIWWGAELLPRWWWAAGLALTRFLPPWSGLPQAETF